MKFASGSPSGREWWVSVSMFYKYQRCWHPAHTHAYTHTPAFTRIYRAVQLMIYWLTFERTCQLSVTKIHSKVMRVSEVMWSPKLKRLINLAKKKWHVFVSVFSVFDSNHAGCASMSLLVWYLKNPNNFCLAEKIFIFWPKCKMLCVYQTKPGNHLKNMISTAKHYAESIMR